MTVKDLGYIKIDTVNPLHIIINKVDGFIEESIGKKLNVVFLVMKVNKSVKNTKSYAVKSEV